MESKPLISVVIPVYNEEKKIERALRSILNQTYQNLEVIVVDDHSSDNSLAVVKKIAQEDPRVVYQVLPNKPARRKNWRGYDINAGFAARNYGFKISHGEWITTQDADDASMANRIETQYELAIQHNATLVTISWQQLKDILIGAELDVTKIIQDNPDSIITSTQIYNQAKNSRGILMIEPWHQFIPFPIKWLPYVRKLFFKDLQSYPGADNCMMFHKKVRDAGIYFRPRNQRTWGVPSGRGSGRDFAFRVAYHFKNSWSFKLPLYLWEVQIQNPEYANYNKYIK